MRYERSWVNQTVVQILQIPKIRDCQGQVKMSISVAVRDAVETDIEAVHEIHCYYVTNTVLTFRHKIVPLEAMKASFHNITERHELPYLVATKGGSVVGYIYADGFRGYMIGYAPTVEISLFCHPDFLGQGIGSILLDDLLERLKKTKHVTYEANYEQEIVESDIRQVLAIMAVDERRQGLVLRDWYLKKGFAEAGRLKNVGYKDHRWYALHANLSSSEHITDQCML